MTPLVADRIFCRVIETGQIPAIADLLHVGFPARSRNYWDVSLRRLAQHVPPEGFPQFGYMLAVADRPVGVHLLISSSSPYESGSDVRCNVSSWYVKDEFRSHGSLLLLKATRKPGAIYTNISPRPETIPIIEAQGFRKFGQGVFAALPFLAKARATPTRIVVRRADWEAVGVPAADQRLLADHQPFGCLSLWCETPAGAQPLIFRRRSIKPGGIPCAQLIYCRSLEHLEEVAAPVGRFLAARGMPLMLVPADRPLRGVPGRYFAEKLPMFFKGAHKPRIGDLSYTEAALFGM
jgi:hypothetical protein